MSSSQKIKFIAKVQISVATNAGSTQMLIYDKRRKHEFEGDASKEVLELMSGSKKEFFYAELIGDKIVLNEKTVWQNW